MLNYQRVIIVVHLHILSISLSMAISTGETETYSFHLISPFLVGKSKLAPGSLLPFYHPRPLRNHGTGADLFVFASYFSGPGWMGQNHRIQRIQPTAKPSIHVQSHLSALAERVDAMAGSLSWAEKSCGASDGPCLVKSFGEPRRQRTRKIVILGSRPFS